jgi:hypothetical protein
LLALIQAQALAPGQCLENWPLIEALKEDAAQHTSGALGVRVVRLRQLFAALGRLRGRDGAQRAQGRLSAA